MTVIFQEIERLQTEKKSTALSNVEAIAEQLANGEQLSASIIVRSLELAGWTREQLQNRVSEIQQRKRDIAEYLKLSTLAENRSELHRQIESKKSELAAFTATKQAEINSLNAQFHRASNAAVRVDELTTLLLKSAPVQVRTEIQDALVASKEIKSEIGSLKSELKHLETDLLISKQGLKSVCDFTDEHSINEASRLQKHIETTSKQIEETRKDLADSESRLATANERLQKLRLAAIQS